MTEAVPPSISAIIVSFNTRELTLRCLTALHADLGKLTAEVFVVDNGSADESVAAVRAVFPAVELIDVKRNIGFGAANNLAISRAKGEFVLLLNTDAFVKPGAIAALVQYLKCHSKTGIVGPRLLNADGSLQKSCYKFPSPARALCEHTLLVAALPNHPKLGDYRGWSHDSQREIDFVIGACMLVRREAITDVGLFDDQFFLYSEETDWCRRFRNHGWTVAFTPTAEVIHLNGSSGKTQHARVFNEFSRASESYIRKHHGRAGLAVFRASMVGGACLRILVFGTAALWPARSARSWALVRKWSRILAWNLGIRGEGLQTATT